jgi:hypothetical protein
MPWVDPISCFILKTGQKMQKYFLPEIESITEIDISNEGIHNAKMGKNCFPGRRRVLSQPRQLKQNAGWA